ncbi:Plasmodium exported protein (PHISTa), unknown, putative [Plasmodium sp. gorilla clade G1]|nr:Plasmodium exported protein (PHISTa), unknown, putative [Plasmodium sp. gorilla clade G1]
MTNKKNSSLSLLYSSDKNKNGKLYYISFKYLCLSLYMIGFYYVFLNNSLENKISEIVNIRNVNKRNLGEKEKNSKRSKWKKNLKHEKEYVNKTNSNINDLKSNEQKVDKNRYSINNDIGNSNMESESNICINNINYNDMSKQLTESELREVLNSFKECPPKEDLRNIWTHTIGVAKEGLDDILNVLKASIQKYLDNDIIGTKNHMRTSFIYDRIWKGTVVRFSRTVAAEEVEYTNKFLRLINEKHTFDDILKFIYSFLDHLNSLKKELHEKYQQELLQKISQTLRSLEINNYKG